MSAALWRAFTRRKVVTTSESTESASPLARVLTTFDLTALGVGSTLGVGVYVLAGTVARDFAGPAVILSFAVAAVASVFAGLCYAEFGARVPLAGSAYIYSYVTIGEFMAFVIGWNLIMEYVIGCASVARGLSNYLDQLMGNAMEDTFREIFSIDVDFMSPYIDFFAFGVSFILSVVLALGVKESMALNNLFTFVNMGVVLFVIVVGSFKADISNWQIEKSTSTVPAYKIGDGGFFPFGVMGVLRGAATCFYGFIGFDCIATTGEEVRNPQRAIPVAIIVSLLIIFLSYFGVSAVLTLMWPYYLQDRKAPLPFVFEQNGWYVAQWIVAIGGIFGLFASLFGAMYPLPRVIYAMANDGLIFRFLGEVHPRYQTPLVGTLLSGVLTGLMGALFKLEQLVNMLSIGTLMAYTIVAACVLLLRYRHDPLEVMDETLGEEAVSLLSEYEISNPMYRECPGSDSDMTSSDYVESTNLVTLKEKPTASGLFAHIFNWRNSKQLPTPVTSYLVNLEVAIFCGLAVILGLCLVYMERELEYGNVGSLIIVCSIGSLMLLVLLSIGSQPTSKSLLPFKVPFVPTIPGLSIVLNIYLMLMLDLHTWIRFSVWMAVGVVVYFLTLVCRRRGWCCSSSSQSQQSAISPPPRLVLGPPSNGVCDIPSKILMDNSNNDSSKLNSRKNDSPVQIKIQYATPLPSRRSSIGSFDYVPPYLFDTETITSHNKENSLVVAAAITIQDDNCSSEETVSSKENEMTHVNKESESASGEDNHVCTVPNLLLTDKDVSSSKICSEVPLNKGLESVGLQEMTLCTEINNEAEPSCTEDGSVSECDARSLYPDVVVISSSDEDTHSMKTNVTDSMDLENSQDCLELEHEKNNQKNLREMEETPEIVSEVKDICTETLEMQKESSSTLRGNLTNNHSIEEETQPFKNLAFVKRLEKIIDNQAHGKPLAEHLHHKPQFKTKSVSDVYLKHQPSENQKQRPASEPGYGLWRAGTNTVLVMEGLDSSESTDLPEGLEMIPDQDDVQDDPFDDTLAKETETVPPQEDIRTRLERILSSGLSRKHNEIMKKKEDSASNKDEATLDKSLSKLEEINDNFAQIEETKKRMIQVLGTLRLKVSPLQSAEEKGRHTVKSRPALSNEFYVPHNGKTDMYQKSEKGPNEEEQSVHVFLDSNDEVKVKEDATRLDSLNTPEFQKEETSAVKNNRS